MFAAELRPPRAELAASEGMDAWIDTYHTVRRLTRSGTFVFLTDNAVGTQEEDNLRHLVTNLGRDVPLERIVPFLTTKHSLEYCLSYADRARQHGFRSLVVLGGDRSVGQARVVAHAWQLRERLRARDATLELGGWANPHADVNRQIDFLTDPHFCAEFYLTQIVSHFDVDRVSAFLEAAGRRKLAIPGIFGVFYYRSANRRTLDTLSAFLPVPTEGLVKAFGAGASPEDVCADTIRILSAAGARHFYVSNLPVGRAHKVLDDVLARAGVKR